MRCEVDGRACNQRTLRFGQRPRRSRTFVALVSARFGRGTRNVDTCSVGNFDGWTQTQTSDRPAYGNTAIAIQGTMQKPEGYGSRSQNFAAACSLQLAGVSGGRGAGGKSASTCDGSFTVQYSTSQQRRRHVPALILPLVSLHRSISRAMSPFLQARWIQMSTFPGFTSGFVLRTSSEGS